MPIPVAAVDLNQYIKTQEFLQKKMKFKKQQKKKK